MGLALSPPFEISVPSTNFGTLRFLCDFWSKALHYTFHVPPSSSVHQQICFQICHCRSPTDFPLSRPLSENTRARSKKS